MPRRENSITEVVFGNYGIRTELVGRDWQLVQLDEAVSDSLRDMNCSALLVVGNQGVGKTRLVSEWIAGQARRRPDLRVLQARAQVNDRPYGLWSRLLRTRFGLTDEIEDPAECVRREVSEVFEDRRMAEILHFLGRFVGVQVRENPFLQALSEDPIQHDQIARTVLLRFLTADATWQPLVLVMDDLHLADNETLKLMAEVGRGKTKAPLTVVGVGRPEVMGRWPDGRLEKPWRKVEVGGLSTKDAGRMFRGLLSKVENLPEEIVSQSVAMTGGNPRFLEELARLLVDEDAVDRSGRVWTINEKRFAQLRLPLSVEEAVQARVAVLSPEERLLLEKASVLGNVFWLGALIVLNRADGDSGVSRGKWGGREEDRAVMKMIESLMTREYIMEMPDSWIVSEREFAFKHNMEYQTIRKGVDPEQVRRWHFHIAQWLEAKVVRKTEEHLEFLAQHYEQGGNARRAAYSYLKAGDKARARYANEQARDYYRRGLALLHPDDHLSRIDALHNLGDVSAIIGDTKSALDAFGQMLWASYLLDRKGKGGAALGRIGRLYRSMGEYDTAIEYYERAHELFLAAMDRRGVAATLDDMGKVMWQKGEFDRALSFHNSALELRATLGDDRSTAFTLGNIGLVYRDKGRFEEAFEYFQRSMMLREKIGDRQGLIHAATHMGAIWLDLGRKDRARQIWEEAHREAEAIGDRVQQAYILANLAEALVAEGDLDGARIRVDAAAEIAENLGDRRLAGECHRTLGKVLMGQEKWSQAGQHFKEALNLAVESRNRSQIGTAHRALGELAYKRKMYAEAEEKLTRALQIFEEMGHQIEIARCCEILAGFYEEMGDTDKAHQQADRAGVIRERFVGAAERIAQKGPTTMQAGQEKIPIDVDSPVPS
ncbi:MAG: tetratricopeptide repeat protein [Deltaproteobacteria bacterium]|nr:tetratricopeptide repeat protein [Deltaproteobacteria bacterium]